MYHLVSLATVVFAVASSVSALAIPRDTAAAPPAPPAGWLTDILESYESYHKYYLSIDCENHHNTTFFDDCCHPLLASQSLDDRPAQCTSASASISAPIANPTSSGDDDEEDCDSGDDEDNEPAVVPTTTPAPKVIVTTPAPEPTTTAAPKPTTTAPPIQKVVPSTTHEAKPATTSPAKKAPSSGSSSSSSGSSQVFTGGIATFFFQNGVAGACGTVHQDSDFIVAIDAARYGDTGEKSPLCGKQVHITNTANKKSVTATIADACPTCDNSNSIDLSTGTFKTIGDESAGVLNIEWFFV